MTTDVIELKDPDFRREVLEAEEPVLVDFTAAWCAPCRAIKPSLEALASQYKGRVKVTRLDVDDNLVTAQEYGIRSMPTLLFFKQGKVVGQIVGAVPRAKLESAFQQVL
ncbi:thioredoxin [Archangium lansingense]|uniref:Thioredoxin n=1 Tax=Archangium lansingense TaxID=2995310 RepID=A0ABT4ANF6_9BACT|nr:thioredoxin [Archangium lansinium]MCY1083111.1 thioredoxin [Archangium lansinium]